MVGCRIRGVMSKKKWGVEEEHWKYKKSGNEKKGLK
jgi:hypothetical protein